ncbi:MAG: hypothetical protein JSW25_10300, partial [Thermoplasmata archaeon]
NYPNRTEVITYQLLTPYYFNITLPEERSVVYILVHGMINGRDFYDTAERGISVNDEPEFNVTAPSAAFVGTNVVINWSIPTTAGSHTENTSVFWDTVSHASAIDGANYAHHSDVLDGDDSRTYEIMLTMPGQAGTVYFVIHCAIVLHGYEYYSTSEHTIELIEEPSVTVTKAPANAFVGADVQFIWTVSAAGSLVEETAIHWDTTSHAGSMDVASYPEMSLWMIGEEDQTYDVTFEMPDEPGTLYFIAHALVLGQDFYVTEELSIVIRDLPTVSVTGLVDEAFVTEEVTVDWEVTGALETDNFITMVLWDVVSHADDPDPANYAIASYGIEWKEAGQYTYRLELPEIATTIYLIASADVKGVNVVSEEVAIEVKALPSVGTIDVPLEAEGGESVTVSFTLNDVDDPETVELVWDTKSQEGGFEYPNTLVATDDGNGTWSVELEVPNEDMEIWYRVHIIDDGNEAYSEEGLIEVDKKKDPEDDSPGFTMLLVVVAISLVAVYVVTDRR